MTINDLLKNQKCEMVRIGDVCILQKWKQLNKEELKPDGEYYYINGGSEPSGKYDKYNTKGDTVIVVNTGGIGGVKYLKNNF